MERTIKRVDRKLPKQEKLIRAAAYCRVSSGKDAMLHSLSAQVSYFSTTIQNHPGGVYVGAYVDEGITGTKEDRPKFVKLMEDCRAGRIDLIITKSVTRFARNTVVLLDSIRELKSMGIDVFFEKENIHTLSADGELMISILASYAQEESRSASENQKWRVKRNFEEGKPWRYFMLGYRNVDGEMTIVPEEAEIVKGIFRDYLAGVGITTIVNNLNTSGFVTQSGYKFHNSAVERILRNYAYTGNLMLQTKYRENHLTKRTLVNNGELPKYHAFETHEPIISLEVFNAVQEEMKRRAEKYAPKAKRQQYPFSGLMVCANCGKNYRRKVTTTGPVWICPTYNSSGKASCASKAIPEGILMDTTASALGVDKFNEAFFHERVSKMVISVGNCITYHMKDGTEIQRVWKDRSRRESWTPEMKEKARQAATERWRANG